MPTPLRGVKGEGNATTRHKIIQGGVSVMPRKGVKLPTRVKLSNLQQFEMNIGFTRDRLIDIIIFALGWNNGCRKRGYYDRGNFVFNFGCFSGP